ncbi:hypothetical protein CMV_027661 [Castanea mollissima]|uniref:Myosin motor domain-containing protein n=1 Tax=Castanea mollissima TaxID=60419 RepID=A0A8J4Q9W8_9ROSI|nr:hypothetical protein CMV_027661 [Castanea mollissima]
MSIGSDQFAEFYGSDRFAGFCGSDRREVCGRRCLFRRRIALLMLLLLRSSQVPDLDIRTQTGLLSVVRNSNGLSCFSAVLFSGFCTFRTYLLERSRVCQISVPKRNYHCFYLPCARPAEVFYTILLVNLFLYIYLLNQASSTIISVICKYKFHFKTFHYLNQSNCYELDGVNDAHEYLATRRAMEIVGINEEEQEAIFRVVAAVLHLGNINFPKGKEIDSSVIKDEKSRFHLNMTAELLRCDAQSLEDALIKLVMVTPEEIITRTLDPENAIASRDAIAKKQEVECIVKQ